MKINYNKHIWEGWTVQSFIDELAHPIQMVMSKNSWQPPFKNKEELKVWCIDHQPYYKKHIPEVVNHFVKQYNLK